MGEGAEAAEAAAWARRGRLAGGRGLLQLLYCIFYVGAQGVRVQRLLPGHGEAGWPEAGACCSCCTVYSK